MYVWFIPRVPSFLEAADDVADQTSLDAIWLNRDESERRSVEGSLVGDGLRLTFARWKT